MTEFWVLFRNAADPENGPATRITVFADTENAVRAVYPTAFRVLRA